MGCPSAWDIIRSGHPLPADKAQTAKKSPEGRWSAGRRGWSGSGRYGQQRWESSIGPNSAGTELSLSIVFTNVFCCYASNLLAVIRWEVGAWEWLQIRLSGVTLEVWYCHWEVKTLHKTSIVSVAGWWKVMDGLTVWTDAWYTFWGEKTYDDWIEEVRSLPYFGGADRCHPREI